MDSWIDNALQSPIDLSSVLVTEPGPGLFIVTTRITTGRAFMAAICGLLALGLLIHLWVHRANWLELIWPNGFLIPFFGFIAIVIGFGFHQKSFNANTHELTI